MKKYRFSALILVILLPLQSHAENCPDPNASSLSAGIVPAPWRVCPFSEHSVQGEKGARFIRANIIVLGHIGRGVICTYQNSVGNYSIWWPVNAKIQAQIDYQWHDSLGGFECRESVEACDFYV